MASNLRVDSIVPATGANVSIGTATGGVNIPGVLTYEDVTNVDSVGIITARTDINLGDSIIHIGDTNTKIRFPAADTISVETAGSERLRIDSSGNISGAGGNILTDSTIIIKNATSDSNGLKISQEASDESRIFNHFNGPLTFGTSNTERMRLLSGGNLLIGRTTASSYGNQLELKSMTVETDGDTTGIRFNRTDSNAAWVAMRFYAQGSQSGYIQINTSSTTYSTSSDYRLKENAVSISDGIVRLKTLKPYKFNFIEDATKTVDGFFAHEVTAVPEAVNGEKDAVDEDGNPDYQVIDHSKLVPLLTAALQEAIAKIETLESKVATLEGS